jgi:hypothetical protein
MKLPLEHLVLAALLGALAIALAGDFIPIDWVQYYALRLWLPIWLLACAHYGLPRVSDRRPWLVRYARVGRGQFAEWGGGPYAAIAIVCFAWTEWAQLRELVQWIVETEWYTDKSGVRDLIRDAARNVAGFFVGSVMNGFYAFVWPAFWKKTFTIGQQWPAVAVAWALFEAGRGLVTSLPGREPPGDVR